MGFFMINRQTAKHHRVDEGLWRHYKDTCSVHDADKDPRERDFFRGLDPPETSSGPAMDYPSARKIFARRETVIAFRLAPSRKGWVAICYETKGLITFVASLSRKRTAWQRSQGLRGEDFDKNWDDAKAVQEGIDNFLWVAECAEAGELLPKA